MKGWVFVGTHGSPYVVSGGNLEGHVVMPRATMSYRRQQTIGRPIPFLKKMAPLPESGDIVGTLGDTYRLNEVEIES